jgi:lysophospholipase
VSTSFRAKTLIAPDKRQLRAGVWDLPQGVEARGICLLLHGLTEFLEKYGETADELRERGFIVVSLDWRSQGASERRHSGNRAGHVGTFEEYDGDLTAIIVNGVDAIQKERAAAGLPALPVIALAHSMGAHILLRFLHENPRRFACAVLVAPMLAVQTGEYSAEYTKAVTFVLNLRRASPRLVFKYEDRDPLHVAFEENLVTSDRGRFDRNLGYLKAQPYLRIHGPTFGWLRAAFRSLRRIERRGFAEEITTPILIVGAGRDRIVVTEAARDFAKRLPNARYVELVDAEHEILMEKDAIRSRFWAEFDAFVNGRLSEPARTLRA